MFIDELNGVKADFELHRKTPEILRSHPDFAGSAFWARSMLRRVQNSVNLLNSTYYLPKTSLADEAKILSESLISSLEEYISKTHSDWVATISPNLDSKLNGKLMAFNGELLEVKFDKDILRLFAEITLFQKLKADIPFHVQEIFSKKEELRILRENVQLVVRDYNNIINTLTKEEHLLFRERIRYLDRKIKPVFVVFSKSRD